MPRTIHRSVGLWLIGLLLAGAGCRMDLEPEPAARPPGPTTPARPTPGARPVTDAVLMPRAYLPVVEALVVAKRQCGLRYVVLPPDFHGVIGPFALDQKVALSGLLEAVAKASNTHVRVHGRAVVFEGKTPAGLTDADVDAALSRLKVLVGRPGAVLMKASARSSKGIRSDTSSAGPVSESNRSLGKSSRLLQLENVQLVYDLGQLHQLRTIVPLSELTASRNERVRLLALRALADLEGDFMRKEWPGRVSVFEVLLADLDVQSLLWALEEGGPGGGTVWRMACSVLARARCSVLTRNTWSHAHGKTPGALQMCIWAIGRVDDPSGAWAIRRRVGRTFTNDPEDAYLAAMALARRSPRRLVSPAKSGNVDARRAAAFGAGFAPVGSTVARDIIVQALRDKDPVVRFMACLSAARIGGLEGPLQLPDMAFDPSRPVRDRAAALMAMGIINAESSRKSVLSAAADGTAAIRATAARMLGDLGGARANATLFRLLKDRDYWVQAEAACSLGRLGSPNSLDAVTPLLSDRKTPVDVRIAAIIGLGRGRNPAAAGALGHVALDPSVPGRIRRYATRALARLTNRAGAATLKRIAQLSSPVHNYEAVRYLDLGSPAETAAMLIPILTMGERSDAASAAGRLAELGYGPGIRALCEGSDILDNSTRKMHMWGAIRARGTEVTDALIRAAGSRRREIRQVAALALGGRANPRAAATLLRLCADTESGVRMLAAQSLGQTVDPAGISTLIALARADPSLRVSDAAVRALRRRDWAGREEVQAVFAELAGSERDCGVPNPDAPNVYNQPAHSFVLRKWPGDFDDLSITNITYESSLTYDSDRGRVVQWGAHGRRYDAPQLGQTWFYDVASNRWTRLAYSRHWPNGTCLNWGTSYDPANRVVVSPKSGHGGHGWINHLRANLTDSVPWVMDARTDQWRAARPVINVGLSLGQVQGDFDTEHDVLLFHHGPVWAYDAYENRWDKSSLGVKRPGYGAASAWDPVSKRLITLAPGGREGMDTWAFDPAAKTWGDLKAEGKPRRLCSRLVYDAANDVMLGFSHTSSRGLQTWVYHLRRNRWEALPVVHPAPRFGCIDCAYDSRHNVVVFSGGYAAGFSGAVNQRETWTYRYKPADPARPGAPGLPGKVANLRLATGAAGQVTLAWSPVKAAQGYRILRGVADRPWEAKLTPLAGGLPADRSRFAEKLSPPGQGKAYYYRVEALDGLGEVIARSRLARTRPAAVTGAWATVGAKGVQVGWAPSPSADVVGYRVYRTDVDLGNPWSRAFRSGALIGRLKLVSGAKPVAETRLLDTTPGIPKPARPTVGGAGAVGPLPGGVGPTVLRAAVDRGDERPPSPSEMYWPQTVAYVIRPVNQWGVEGGDSPATLALPDVPGPVRVIPWADGRRLVVWPPSQAGGVAGYHLMRMDDWIGTSVYRYNASPVSCVGYYDDEEFPTADRRRYYVLGVDGAGTLGIPSSGAWSHGFP